MDHPLLVLGKGSNEEEAADKLLDPESGNEAGTLKEMIAAYAGGGGVSTGDKGGGAEAVDPTYADQVLKEMENVGGESECFICASEVFDEVLLPCYHRG